MSLFYFPLKPTRISIESSVFKTCDADPNFIAQKKKDGWRIQIHKLGSEIKLFTRHNRPLEGMISDIDWEEVKNMIGESVGSHSCILDGELLHRRGKEKESFYLWDIFEKDNKRLSLPYEERKIILNSLISSSSNFQVLEDYKSGFYNLWESLNDEADEGIVIKDLREPLYVSFSKTTKSPKQYKILLKDPRNLLKDVG